MSNYSVTVRAPDNAFRDFGNGLRDAFCTTDVQALFVTNVVEIEGTRVTEPAIDASGFCFVFADPLSYFSGSRIVHRIYALAVSRGFQATISPLFLLLAAWGHARRTCSTLTEWRAKFGDALGLEYSTAVNAVKIL